MAPIGVIIIIGVGGLLIGAVLEGTQSMTNDPAVIAAITKLSPWVADNFSVLSKIVIVIMLIAVLLVPISMATKDANGGGDRLETIGAVGGYAISRCVLTIACLSALVFIVRLLA